jgi:predicted signal transduction protein with EAL and GGDEF domain
MSLARRLIKAVGAPYDIDGARVVIGTSIGIAVAGDINDASHMLENADTALYRAKADHAKPIALSFQKWTCSCSHARR